MTTDMRGELARKNAAEIAVFVEEAPEPVFPQVTKLALTGPAKFLLRLAALLCVAAALFQIWCAATGYRP